MNLFDFSLETTLLFTVDLEPVHSVYISPERQQKDSLKNLEKRLKREVKAFVKQQVADVKKTYEKIEDVDKCSCKEKSESPCSRMNKCHNCLLQIECSSKNCFAETCENRQFVAFLKNREPFAGLAVRETGKKGKGLFATRAVAHNALVCVYTGKLVPNANGLAGLLRAYLSKNVVFSGRAGGRKKHSYLMHLERHLCVDAEKDKGPARFLNHSCAPNCRIEKWAVLGFPQLGVFTDRLVASGEELTFDYRMEFAESLGKCFCGAAVCRKSLATAEEKAGELFEVLLEAFWPGVLESPLFERAREFLTDNKDFRKMELVSERKTLFVNFGDKRVCKAKLKDLESALCDSSYFVSCAEDRLATNCVFSTSDKFLLFCTAAIFLHKVASMQSVEDFVGEKDSDLHGLAKRFVAWRSGLDSGLLAGLRVLFPLSLSSYGKDAAVELLWNKVFFGEANALLVDQEEEQKMREVREYFELRHKLETVPTIDVVSNGRLLKTIHR